MSSANNNYVMSFSNPTPNDYVITPGVASQVVFTVEPANTVAEATIGQRGGERGELSLCNVETSDNSSSVTLRSDQSRRRNIERDQNGDLSSGVATFSTLSINAVGNGYTLYGDRLRVADGRQHRVQHHAGDADHQWVTASQSIPYSTASVTLTGTVERPRVLFTR